VVVELSQSNDRGGGRLEDVTKLELPLSSDIGESGRLEDVKI
jgi:hypothetical protein